MLLAIKNKYKFSTKWDKLAIFLWNRRLDYVENINLDLPGQDMMMANMMGSIN